MKNNFNIDSSLEVLSKSEVRSVSAGGPGLIFFLLALAVGFIAAASNA